MGKLKPWMRAVLWLVLGGGVGYFIGEQVGERRTAKAYDEERNLLNERVDKAIDKVNKAIDENKCVKKAIKEYLGDKNYAELTEEDIPDMPTEDDISIDEDIPQLHPTMLTPELIGEEEYNANIWGYDLENLVLYEGDDVLYDETTQNIIQDPDYVIGVGTLAAFGGDPNNPVDTLYVKNDTYGTLFRIDRVDGAFCDEVDGQIHPEEDEAEEEEAEDFTDDDYWGDV